MAFVQDLLDRLKQLQSDRVRWEKHWYDIARYVLPDAERFDRIFQTADRATAINAVTSEPVAADRSREVYDQTSLWAVERGAAGTLSLVTPQTTTWHDLTLDDPFGREPDDQERLWLDMVRDYLFRVRANPRSGFWANHKAALRCMWAFGTAVTFIGESARGAGSPFSYAFVPLSENHLGTNFEGVVDTNFRMFARSARQCVERWGALCSPRVQKMTESAKDKDRLVTILHAITPREERGTYGNTNRDSPFASCYVEVQERHLIGESGFWEFPFRVDYWQRSTPQPYAEGPVALALADIKSLNMLSKTTLRAAQQSVDPPLATHATVDGIRLNLNPRAVNPGYVNASGQLLAQPIVTARPDFAEAILETKRNQIRTTTYVDLWTAILDADREMTAYEVQVKNQERADMIGPVGTSLQAGLSFQIEREIGILARLGAFAPGSPLEAPDSLQGQAVGPRWTSPLDRARRLGELQGVQNLWSLAAQLAEAKPEILDKLDADETLDFAQEVLGAPERIMVPAEIVAGIRQQRAEQAGQDAAVTRAAAVGQAAAMAAEGADAMAASPAAQEMIKRLAGVAEAAA